MRNRKHDIEKYLRGELSPTEMHALEKEALSDPFLAEALEGIEHAGADNFLYDLHKLNRSVHDRMRRKTRKNSKTIRMWGWTSAVAATILLIAVSGFLVVKILRDQQMRHEQTSANPDILKDTTTGEDSLAVDKADSSLLALKEPQPETEALARTASPITGGLEKRPDEKVEAPPAETLGRERAAIGETIHVEAEADDAQSKKEAPAHVEPLARAEVDQKDSLIRATPSGDQALSKALEGKVAGVDTRSRNGAPLRSSGVPAMVVRGKVTSEDGHVLPGVNVIIQGAGRGAVTDSEGNYELTVPEGTKLVFGFIGFESQEIVPESGELNVTLEEDLSTLSEVVVTGFGEDQRDADRSSFRLAEPDGGRTDFNTYLSNAVKYPQEAIRNKTEGKVTISFTVEPSGNLTDFEVVKGIGSGCEEELIRAIQQGPYWKPSTRGEQPVKDKVRVKFRFNLPQ